MIHISKLATYSFAVLTPWFIGGQASATAAVADGGNPQDRAAFNSYSKYKDLGTSVSTVNPTVKSPSVKVLLGATPVGLSTTDREIKTSPEGVNHLGAISKVGTPVLGAGLVGGNQVNYPVNYPVNSVAKVTTETGITQGRLTSTASSFSGVADSGYDSAPLAPQFWGEQNSESPPKLGDLGGLTKTRRSLSPPKLGDLGGLTKTRRSLSSTLVSQVSQSSDASDASDATNASESPNASPIPPDIQEKLREYKKRLELYRLATESRKPRTAFPGFSLANPSGFGADKFQGFIGAGFQSRTRYSGGQGGLLGNGSDGTLGFGFGVGDAKESVGLQISYSMNSFGGSRAFGSGAVNAKLHTQFDRGWGVAVGGEGIIEVGNDGAVDVQDTYYGAVTKVLRLRDNIDKPFGVAVVTVGAGTGRFRSEEKVLNGENGFGVFGGVGVGVLPWLNVITEWTGQDLTIGASIAPFKNIPIVITPAVRDITGAGDGARFVMGVGGSVGDVISLLDLIF
ncbi:hypothetical protein [Moorena sp. SIO4G3]|uniref:hypothetical protein n=1 Tax=Moorena sp. SIO4G3 TaxID=2607821 RepID=UPI00142A73C9|nr:hypothetical protein [Moorena sp. SIO4G3]NEO80340.1 hypothetical protein [Moorena sp. SIO4G3]